MVGRASVLSQAAIRLVRHTGVVMVSCVRHLVIFVLPVTTIVVPTQVRSVRARQRVTPVVGMAVIL